MRVSNEITLEGVAGASIAHDVGGGCWGDSEDLEWNTLRGPNGEVKQIRITPVDDNPAPGGSMHRLYNSYSGEHFYTASDSERDYLVELGWTSEGEGWTAPETSDTPVYRLYNPNAGEHHYTTSPDERDFLTGVGWNDEGIGWYSDDARGQVLYRVYNPNAFANNHHYTASDSERDYLLSVGWNDEGTAWYGVA